MTLNVRCIAVLPKAKMHMETLAAVMVVVIIAAIAVVMVVGVKVAVMSPPIIPAMVATMADDGLLST